MHISTASTHTTSTIHQTGSDTGGQANQGMTRLNEGDKQTMLQSRAYSEMLKERTGQHLLLTAHRGTGPTSVFGSSFPDKYLPENTLPAIKAAILEGGCHRDRYLQIRRRQSGRHP